MTRIKLYFTAVILILVALSAMGCASEPASTQTLPDVTKSAFSVTTLQEVGGRVSWSPNGKLIAFDRIGSDGYYDVYTMDCSGSDLHCLTGEKEGLLPQANNGNPAWYPSGKYLVIQVENPELKGFSYAPDVLERYITSPGVGINNDLWLMSADGTQFWQLTYVSDRYGTLHPHFSPDGTKLLWSEIISPAMDKIGQWAIKLADFTLKKGEPLLSNIVTVQPLSLQLYEVHGFSPDGKTIIFSGVAPGKHYYDMEIYVMDLATRHVAQLTDNDEWDEHAHFTPDGHHIVWVSSEGIPQPKGDSLQDTLSNPPKLDYWIMNSDGSGKRRLTGFNRPDEPDYISVPGGVGLGDFDWAPNGEMVAAKLRRGKEQDLTVLINFGSRLSGVKPAPLAENITTIVEKRGGRVDWGSNNLIAHSRYGEDGYYDLWVMKPDGTEARCLTCNNPDIPQLHNGQPTWHPSGNYIVFQSQDPSLPHTREDDYVQTQPGFGKHNNLWVTDPQGNYFYQLTHIKRNRAILHPHFSHDGTKLMWSEKTGFRSTDWAIMIAGFVETPEPQLVSITSCQPLGDVWYETHAFSPDDSRILFTAGDGSGSWSGFDIWEMELASGELRKLTDDPDVWDEHAHYSPNGTTIVWASSRGYPYNTETKDYGEVAKSLKLDYWLMDADGSNKQRLTYFNEPGHKEYTGYSVIVADSSWSPDGKQLAATVLSGRGRENTMVVIIDLNGHPTKD